MNRKKESRKKSRFGYKSLAAFFLVSLVSLVITFVFPKVWHSQNQCANSISCIKNLSGKFEKNQDVAEFLGNKILVPGSLSKSFSELASNGSNVLGQTTAQKKIFVDLSTQHLYAFEGNKKVYDFLVSTGKWYPTPTGTFKVWVKLRFTRMSGGNPGTGTYYNLPNVPYVMFYSNAEVSKDRGFSLHGAYWHNNFGHPMSHGCVNMRIEDAEKIYNWISPSTSGPITYASNENEGTEIIIFGEPPEE